MKKQQSNYSQEHVAHRGLRDHLKEHPPPCKKKNTQLLPLSSEEGIVHFARIWICQPANRPSEPKRGCLRGRTGEGGGAKTNGNKKASEKKPPNLSAKTGVIEGAGRAGTTGGWKGEDGEGCGSEESVQGRGGAGSRCFFPARVIGFRTPANRPRTSMLVLFSFL